MIHNTIHLPCGASATFCYEAGFGHRCNNCWAVVGSIGQPRECVEATNKYKVLKMLGSNVVWDYEKGCEATGGK
jgi:hypothetical protein